MDIIEKVIADKSLTFDDLNQGDVFRFADDTDFDGLYMKVEDIEKYNFVDLIDGEMFVELLNSPVVRVTGSFVEE